MFLTLFFCRRKDGITIRTAQPRLLSPHWNEETVLSQKFVSPDSLQRAQEIPTVTNRGVLVGLSISLHESWWVDHLGRARSLLKGKVKSTKFRHDMKSQKAWQCLNSSNKMPRKERAHDFTTSVSWLSQVVQSMPLNQLDSLLCWSTQCNCFSLIFTILSFSATGAHGTAFGSCCVKLKCCKIP